MKDLTTTRKVKAMNEIMLDLESEIGDIKSGRLAESKARIVSTYRRMQLRTLEIYLAAVRLERRMLPGLAAKMGEPTLPAPESSAKSIRARSRKEVAA
jgi:hypothetical protein